MPKSIPITTINKMLKANLTRLRRDRRKCIALEWMESVDRLEGAIKETISFIQWVETQSALDN